MEHQKIKHMMNNLLKKLANITVLQIKNKEIVF